MITKWVSILMALLGISAIILPAIADCGCEDEVYMRVTYIERHTGIKKTVYTAARGWWPINYRADSYSPNRIISRLMSEYPTELLFMERLSRGASFRVMKQATTPALYSSFGEKKNFAFIAETGEQINYKNIRTVEKIQDLKVGCGVAPDQILNAQFEALTKGAPLGVKVRKEVDHAAGTGRFYVYHDIEYLYKDKKYQFTVSPAFDGRGGPN